MSELLNQKRPQQINTVNLNKSSKLKQQGQQSPSYYPSSASNSPTRSNKPTILQLTQQEQQLVSAYLGEISEKGLKQLIKQRQQLLQQLHFINGNLNDMINQLYGDLKDIDGNNKEMDVNNKENVKNDNQKQVKQYKQERQLKTIQQYEGQSKQSNNKSTIKSDYNKQINQLNKNVQNNINKQQVNILSQNELITMQLKNEKLIKSLYQQINDYEFMLTGQYIQKLQQSISNQLSHKKLLQLQVTSLDKQINKHTKLYDKQTITKLQKSSYDHQLQLSLNNKKLQTKLLKLVSIQTQSHQKITKTQLLTNQQLQLQKLLEMYQDQQYQSQQTILIKKSNYSKLINKKQKLFKIINSYNNNHLKLYNKKLNQFRDIDLKIQSLKQTIKQMDYNILVITKQRKQYQQDNHDILSKNKQISSLNNINTKQITTLINNRKASLHHHYSLIKNIQTPQYSDTEDINVHKRNSKVDIESSNNIIRNKQKQFKSQSKQYLNKNLNKQINKTYGNDQQLNQYHNEDYNTSNKRYQSKDTRRRLYTELQNSHYFSSLQKNKFKKKIHSHQAIQNPLIKVKTQQQIPNKSFIRQKPIQVPTSDRQSQQKQLKYKKLNHIHQKKFNLRNTPLMSQSKSNKQDQQSQKQFSFNQNVSFNQNGNNLRKSDMNQNNNYQKQKYIPTKQKSLHRKGISNEYQKQSEDQINNKLINLEKLLKNDAINLNQKMQSQYQSKVFQRQKKRQPINGKIVRSVKSGKSSSNQKQKKSQPNSNIKFPDNYYKELCQKLGKDKLLIQEDTDISGLLYQGISGKYNK